jgi:putative cell wall-binding protein
VRSLTALALVPALVWALLVPTLPATAAAGETGTAPGLLNTLTVTEPTALGYDRELFPHWIDADGDGCDTRREVLIAESTAPLSVGPGCSITGGQWTSWVDGATWSSPSDVDIDHVVPLKEAWVSGASAWTTADRTAFANDLDNPGSLDAVTSAVNSSKGASDPARWLPPLASAHCTYATEWVKVKYRWRLSVDAAERDTLGALLAGECGTRQVGIPYRGIGENGGQVAPPAGVVGTQRLSGADRYGTAARIAREFSTGVAVAYVASGLGYADALSAAPAAAKQGGPLLLVPQNSLPVVVTDELRRLKPRLIVVVGGESMVSARSYAHLATLATEIRRDSGTDRYATSRIIAQQAFDNSSEAFVATGANFPDALSAAAAAGAASAPVLLVKGTAGTLGNESTALLRSLGVNRVTIAGGVGVVSTGVETSLRQVPGVTSVVRAAGTDRYLTSASVVKHIFSSAQRAFYAVGTNYADALAGAALAGAVGAPLYVVRRTCVPTQVRDQVAAFGTTGFTLLGGSAVLADAVAASTLCPVVTPPKPAPPKPPVITPPKNPGDTKNCTDFATYAEALAWYRMYLAYGDVARLDHDNDGRPCESLPGAP